MEQPAALKILFIINRGSGTGNKNDINAVIKNYFKDLPHAIEFFELTGKDDTGSINYWISKLQATRIVAVGGDGTINAVAKILLGTQLQLGILPTGSANGLARELDIPQDIPDALDIIVHGKVKACDVIKINNDSICLHLSDLGMNARIIKYFDESPLRGMYGYARILVKALWYKKLMTAHIIADGVEINTNAYMIVIANARMYGTGIQINPDGLTDDGLFEIVVVKKVSLARTLKLFINKNGLNPKEVEIYKTSKAMITTSRKTHFQIDGEYKGKLERVAAEIVSGKLNLLVKN